MQYLRKMISLFYNNHYNKLIVTFTLIDVILSMIQPIIKHIKLTESKQKHGCQAINKANKQTKI